MRLVPGRNAIENDSAPLYVYNTIDGNGFVIVAGDDRARRILGYSDSGSFDFGNLPPQLEWLLSVYESEIKSLNETNNNDHSESTTSQNDRNIIAPLLTTEWGQATPFNQLCPEYEGQPLATGCVATAIAQIINYHKWPEKGEGTHSYDLFGKKLSWDFENTVFNWNLMLDNYNGESPAASNAEVAKLMYAVGVGCNMGYTPDGSGSCISFAKRALVENLRYDTEMEIVWRNHYLPEKWHDLIYAELSSERPVFLSGGDHAFVCDGYAGDNLFHFNWGWSGVMDGNFSFSSLPDSNNESFGNDLTALINIHKREGERKALTYDVICKGGIKLDSENYNSDYIDVDLCYNYSAYDMDITFGLEIINNETGESNFISGPESHLEAPVAAAPYVAYQGHGQGMFDPFLGGTVPLPDGYYSVYPAFTTSVMPLKRILCVAGYQDHIDLKVYNNSESHIFTNPGLAVQPDVELTELTITDEAYNPVESIYAHESIFRFTYTLKNNSSVASTNNTYDILDENENIIFTDALYDIIEPHSEIKRFTSVIGTDIAPGSYHIKVFDASSKCINTRPVNFTAIKREYDLEVTDIQYIPKGGVFDDITFVLKNNANIDYNPIIYIIATKNEVEVQREKIPSGLKANEIYNITFKDIINTNFRGDIEFNFYEPYGQRINKTPYRKYFNVPVTSIGFETWGIMLKKGESEYLIPVISPEDATNKTLNWESNNPNIAQVDQDGKVTAIAEGTTVITVTATDGSGVSGSCNVEVFSDSQSGIDTILCNKYEKFTIYSPSGIMIRTDCDAEDLKGLSPGIYIVKHGSSVHKVVIR